MKVSEKVVDSFKWIDIENPQKEALITKCLFCIHPNLKILFR